MESVRSSGQKSPSSGRADTHKQAPPVLSHKFEQKPPPCSSFKGSQLPAACRSCPGSVRKTDEHFRSDPGRIQHGSTSGSCPELVPSKIAMFYTIAVMDFFVHNIVPDIARHRASRKIGAFLCNQLHIFKGSGVKTGCFCGSAPPAGSRLNFQPIPAAAPALDPVPLDLMKTGS